MLETTDNTKDIDVVMPMYNSTWLEKCFLSNDTKATTFAITDTKLYVLVVPLLTRDITKLLQQLKSGLKITINWKNFNQM